MKRIDEIHRIIDDFHRSNRSHGGDPQVRHDAAMFALGAISAIVSVEEK